MVNAERDTLIVGPSLRIPIAEIAFRFETSGGAGGQHANRARTKVEASFDVLASATLSEAERNRIVRRAEPSITSASDDAHYCLFGGPFPLRRSVAPDVQVLI